MLVKLFDIQSVEGQRLAFKDEKSIPGWAYSYIKAAVNGGIIKGYADNTFRSQGNISRAEASAISKKYLDGKNKNNI